MPEPYANSTLSATGIDVSFTGVQALQDVSIEISRGEIVGLIGPNGSGKTTYLNVLSGFVKPSSGNVRLEENEVTGWSPGRRVRSGLARTFQGVRLFGGLTVFENVEIAGIGAGMGRRGARKQARRLLEEMGLAELSEQPASALGAGDERRLGIVRAVATDPHYLLLDEPAAGLNEAESVDLVAVIRSLAGEYGCGVLLVEHDMRVIMSTCARLHVLDSGRTIASGLPEEVRSDPAVVTAYFGEDEVEA